MKILLSAYACEPGLGSEEGVGWNMALEIAQHHEVWVLTRTFSCSAIETELSLHPNPNLHFVYFEPLGWSEDWKGTHRAVQLHYYLWQIQAYYVGQALHQKVKFDLAHHVTYVRYWSPSLLSFLPIPFVWGPVGGGEAAPKTFWRDFNLSAKIYETLRDLAQRIGEVDPLTRNTAQRSVVAFATTEDTAKRLPPMGAKVVQVFPEAGLSLSEIDCFAQYKISNALPIRFISIGRLLHWKGFHLGLRAFLNADIPNAEYWLLGDGPERKQLEKIIKEYKRSSRVKFWGKLPRNEAMLRLEECHVVVHPSLHDSGGWTCLEAMATGRPVICLDLGGPGVQIINEVGIKVPAHNPEQAVNELATAMIQLASDSDLRTQMGQAGQRRVREYFSWEVKGQFFSNLYQEVLTKSKGDRPLNNEPLKR